MRTSRSQTSKQHFILVVTRGGLTCLFWNWVFTFHLGDLGEPKVEVRVLLKCKFAWCPTAERRGSVFWGSMTFYLTTALQVISYFSPGTTYIFALSSEGRLQLIAKVRWWWLKTPSEVDQSRLGKVSLNSRSVFTIWRTSNPFCESLLSKAS